MRTANTGYLYSIVSGVSSFTKIADCGNIKSIFASFRASDDLWIAKTNDATVPIDFNGTVSTCYQAPSERVNHEKNHRFANSFEFNFSLD